jgi:hypothetical protein
MKALFLSLILIYCLNVSGQSTIGIISGSSGAGSNTLNSVSNVMTSDVDGIIDTAAIISANALSWNSINGLLTSTVNGVIGSTTIPRVSQSFPMQNGVADTRTGAIGTAGTNIFAAWDHQHPIIRMAQVSAPVLTASGFLTYVSQSIIRQHTTEETQEYSLSVATTTNGIGTWGTISIPNLTGYRLIDVNVTYYDITGGSLNSQRPPFVWSLNTIYVMPQFTNRNITFLINLRYVLN